jgi:hypothetical protein
MKPYEDFLRAKVQMAESFGFEITAADVNPKLKAHQVQIVIWAVAGGRRAIFCAFGLGKTVIQLETVRITRARAGGMGLIVIPLGVRQEFMRDAAMLGIPVKFVRRIEECDDPEGIYLTNYETVRDGKLDPRLFNVASLDEAACLRGFGGTKTFREFMALFAGDDRRSMHERLRSDGVRYRFVATATPSPNEYIELLAYCAFLGVMDVGQAKTRFFKRDSTKADKLTIHAHKEREFWLWMASWALFVQKPSDLGCSDEGYDLPPLEVIWHEVDADHAGAGHESYGQARMFKAEAIGVIEAAREKRDSLGARVNQLMEIVNVERSEARLQQGLLPEEPGQAARRAEGTRAAIRSCEPGASTRLPQGVPGGEPREPECCAAGDEQGSLPGEQAVVQGAQPWAADQELRADAGNASRHPGVPGASVPDLRAASRGTERAFDRPLSCDGIGQGGAVSQVQRGAGDAGGQRGECREGAGLSEHPSAPGFHQMVVWCDLNDEQRAIEKALASEGISFASLFGSQDLEAREALFDEWRARERCAFVSKPTMYGAGVNLQQAHTMVFVGIDFKFSNFIQALHRIYRFLQKHPCRVHIIYTSAERSIRRDVERKWKQHIKQMETMTEIIREFGLSRAAMAHVLTRKLGVERVEARGEHFVLANNDCVDETKRMESDSVGLILTSIPFSTQYEYSPNYADFGHTDSNEHFFEQMDYLTPELLRVLHPGRLAAIHVKDRIVPGGMTGLGFQTVYPFHCKTIEHFTRHGFAYMGMKTIVTDVVRENNQTYRLGWSEQCKDASKMSVGMPEYLLIFRKPPSDLTNSYADKPVVKLKPFSLDTDGNMVPFDRNLPMVAGKGYSRSRWQIDAHGFTRSSGNRLLTPEQILQLPHDVIFKLFKKHSLENVYDFEHHVALCEAMEVAGKLPVTFMLMQPQSWSDEVWADVTRMLTLNGAQSAKGKEMHLCPMQFDIADRAIAQWTMPGEEVYDPFGGLMTVPFRAIKAGRRGRAAELSPSYFLDGVSYCEAMEREQSMPSLFDLEPVEEAEAA